MSSISESFLLIFTNLSAESGSVWSIAKSAKLLARLVCRADKDWDVFILPKEVIPAWTSIWSCFRYWSKPAYPW